MNNNSHNQGILGQEQYSSFTITTILEESESRDEAFPKILDTIFESFGWVVADFWLIDFQKNILRYEQMWHIPSIDIKAFQLDSKAKTFNKGQGLPGQVWEKGLPYWISDVTKDDNFYRQTTAHAVGLYGACGFPVFFNKQLIGVFEFFNNRVLTPESEALKVINDIGHRLSLFIEQRKTLKALKEKEEKYSDLLEHTSVNILHISAEGKILYTNRIWREMLGYNEEEIINLSLIDIIHPDSQHHYKEIFSQLMAGQKIDTVEISFIGKDGKRIFVDSSMSAKAEIGKPLNIWCISRDITTQKNIEEQLKQTSAIQKVILNSANFSIISTDIDGTIRTFNQTAEKWLGYEANELIGKLTPAIIHKPEEVVARAHVLSKELGINIEPGFEVFVVKARFGVADENEWSYIRKDGSSFPVLLSVTALYDEAKNLKGFLGLAQDITEQRKIKEIQGRRAVQITLRANVGAAITKAENLQDILQKCVEVIIKHLKVAFARIWTLNSESNILELQSSAGCYTHINGAHARVPVGKFKIGLIAQERKPHLTNDVINDPRVGNKEWAKQEGMVAFAGYPLIVEDRLVGVLALFSRNTLEDDTLDTLATIVDIIAQVIERKRAETTLQENEQRLSSIISSAMDAIITINEEKQIVVFNQAAEKLFCWTAAEALGQPIDKLIPARFRNKHTEDINLFGKTGITSRTMKSFGVIFGLRSSGEEFPIEATISKVESAGQKFYTVILRDITERKKSEEQLRDYAHRLEIINRELDQFAYVVSHDLKAPLRAIAHLSEWLEEDLGDKLDEDSRQNMKLIHGRVNRMEGLINGILEYSRVGRIRVSIEEVNVELLLKEVIDLLAPPVGFSIEVQPGMPIIKTDRVSFSQVFSNLISNAIKYHNKAEGHICISISEQENFYEFAVSDDGPGIDPLYHNKIFEIFQTLEARDKVESTGIGLAIVKKIIESHGGIINLESNLGQGATFRFTWPKNKG